MTIYINIRNTGTITVMCHYGDHHYVGCNRSLYEEHHEVDDSDHYYTCNATPDQQYEPICVYCMGNKHRKWMNLNRTDDEKFVDSEAV